jgi:hypothetical protein
MSEKLIPRRVFKKLSRNVDFPTPVYPRARIVFV